MSKKVGVESTKSSAIIMYIFSLKWFVSYSNMYLSFVLSEAPNETESATQFATSVRTQPVVPTPNSMVTMPSATDGYMLVNTTESAQFTVGVKTFLITPSSNSTTHRASATVFKTSLNVTKPVLSLACVVIEPRFFNIVFVVLLSSLDLLQFIE